MQPARNLIMMSAVAAVLAVAGCAGDEPRATSAPPSDRAAASPSGGPTDLQGVAGSLEPGSYSLTVWGETDRDPLARAVVEVPAGWYSDGGWVIDSGNSIGEPEQIGQISVWKLNRVLADPCRPGTAADPGDTVADVARALADQSGPSTRPRPVTLDGHHGLALEVTIPPERDRTTCTDTRYTLWPGNIQDVAGVVNHLWVLDVDDTPLVVVVTAYPDQPNEQPEDLLAVAETITFEDARS